MKTPIKSLDRYFRLSAQDTTVRKELVAGLTTFPAMAYITAVNPGILADAGMDFGAVFVATCLAAAVGTLIMGLAANYPIALAPGMGQNAFFTYGIVLTSGHSWQTALGAVFISGLLFIVLSILPIREWLINAIPRSLKLRISAGIGFFLAIIALSNGGIVVDDPTTLVSLGDLTEPPAILLFGTSSTTGYIESAAGVESGGRTGLAAVVTALAMPLIYSIADGIGLGFICYAVIKLFAGEGRECPIAVYLVAVIFALKFAFLMAWPE